MIPFEPDLSRTLRDLREWFGDPLLVRSGHTMVRTPFAELLRPRLARTIAELRELARPNQEFRPESARSAVRIACTDYMALLVLAAWDEQVAPKAPHLNLEFLAPSLAQYDELTRGCP